MSLVSAHSYGQENWDLEQCIQYALDNNLQIRQSELQAQLSEEDLLLAKGQVLPTLNGFGNHIYNIGQTIDPYTNTFAQNQVQSNNFSLSTGLNLFAGLQNYNAIKQAQTNVMASREDVADQKNNVSLNVALAYLQILQNEELFNIAKEQRDIIASQVTQTEKLVRVGSAADGDLFDIQAQLANEDASVITAENNLKLAYLQLKQLLQLDASTPFQIKIPNVIVDESARVSLMPETVYQQAEATLPSIKGAEYRLRSSERGISLARGRISPVLAFTGAIGTGYSENQTSITNVSFAGNSAVGFVEGTNATVYSPTYDYEYEKVGFFDQLDNNLNKSFGFTLQIPLFNGFSTHTAINKAKIQNEIAAVNLEVTKNQVKQDIEQAYADARAALNTYRATEKSVQSFQTAFDYAQKRFGVGMINAVEFNTAKNNLNRAQSELVRAKYTFVFRMKILDFYMGNPIQL